MKNSVSGRKKSICWQILPPSILKQLTQPLTSYQHKLKYLLQTIPNTEDQLKKVNEVVQHILIPAIIGGHIINDAERVMLSLPTPLGGLGLRIFTDTAENEFKDSKRITSSLQA